MRTPVRIVHLQSFLFLSIVVPKVTSLILCFQQPYCHQAYQCSGNGFCVDTCSQFTSFETDFFLSRYYNNCVLFSLGKILETLSPKHLPSSHHPLNPLSLTVRPPPSPPSQPPTPPRTPLSPPHHKSSSSPLPTHHAQHPQTSGQSSRSSPHTPQMAPQSLNQHGEHQAAAVYESLRHKMANSMAKLAGLPPDSIIGNPRVSNSSGFQCCLPY